MNLEGKTVAKKENSGFTHAINIEPITYRPDEDFHAAHSVSNVKCFYKRTIRPIVRTGRSLKQRTQIIEKKCVSETNIEAQTALSQ